MEPNILYAISGSDVSIHSSDDDSYCSDDYEDDLGMDIDGDDDVKMVSIIFFFISWDYRDEIIKLSISHVITSFKGSR